MRSIFTVLIALIFLSCSKEDLHGPLQLKNGQEVELLVDHRYGSTNDRLLMLPKKEDAGASLSGFGDREPGYTYRVKARFHYEENPPQDGPAYWFDFLKYVEKERYNGDDTFEVQLIVSYIPGGPFIRIVKQGDDYFMSEKIQLTYANDTVKSQLEELWQNARETRENVQTSPILKWKAATATVVHDPQKFGKAYLVQQIVLL